VLTRARVPTIGVTGTAGTSRRCEPAERERVASALRELAR
jgi:hypothetical protein